MTPHEERVEMETCTVAQLEGLQHTSKIGRLVRNTTIMLVQWQTSEWRVRLESFLPQIDSNELVDVLAVRMHRRFWLEEARFSSIAGVRSLLHLLEDLSALPRSA